MLTIAAATLLLLPALHVHGESVKGIASRVKEPVLARGGALMLPLAGDREGDNWPSEIDLRFADGSKVTGTVVWIEPAAAKSQRHWTDDPRRVVLRTVRPDDDSSKIDSAAGMGPYLLARCPSDQAASGDVRLEGNKLHPTWRDLPADPGTTEGAIDERGTLDLVPAPNRPDPVSPFEYWRWVLLAQRMDLKPPTPFGGEIEQLAAAHYAQLWRIGLARLAKISERIASECIAMLTHTCIDERQPFAAWVIDPVQIGTLLAALTNFDHSDADLLSDVAAWIDAQPRVQVWPESETVDQVRIAAFALGSEIVSAKVYWRGAPPDRFLAVPLAPGVLSQVSIDRPPEPEPLVAGMPRPQQPEPDVLVVEADGRRSEFTVGPRSTTAKPPGVFLRPLAPPISLAEVQLRVQQFPGPDRQTLASVRKLGGRWEVFIDCRRPGGGAPAPEDAADQPDRKLPEHLGAIDDVRGVEAVTILLGDEDESGDAPIWLTVPERGFQNLARGESDGTLQVHKRSFADRWYCRIVLPDAWIPTRAGEPLRLGVIRSHGDIDQLETGPAICTPWNPRPGRAAINVNAWDDLPQAE